MEVQTLQIPEHANWQNSQLVQGGLQPVSLDHFYTVGWNIVTHYGLGILRDKFSMR